MISIDATSSGQNALTTTLTVAHTCDGTNRELWVSLYCSDSLPNPTGVTYAGVPMNLLDSADTGGPNLTQQLYWLLAPALGTNNIVVSFSVANQVGITCASYKGVKQVSPEANAKVTGVASPFNFSIATITNGAWVIWGASNSDSAFTATGSNFKRIESTPSNIVAIFDSNGAVKPPASWTNSASWTGGRNGSAIAAVMAPAQVGGNILALL